MNGETDLSFWESDFQNEDERIAEAFADPDVIGAFRLVSPSERTVSGDGLVAFEKLVAERYGLDNVGADRLLETFWGARDKRERNTYG